MKRLFLWLTGLLFLSGCNQVETILYSPQQTGAEWLERQPFVELELGIREFILVQPSSTAFVYMLGVLTVGFGIYFLRNQENHLSRKWWGAALLFWGIGALLAGTSYQALSYEIKCAGQEFCSWTSWWEIVYLVFSVASVNAMMLAVAYSSAVGKTRKRMSIYALANFGLYSLVVLIGVLIPLKFLISFELMLLFLAPSIVFLLILNIKRYQIEKKPIDLALIKTWIGLGITIGVYYLYLMLGYTERLWETGIWFSENDVLHIGLILWMIYIRAGLSKTVEDLPV